MENEWRQRAAEAVRALDGLYRHQDPKSARRLLAKPWVPELLTESEDRHGHG